MLKPQLLKARSEEAVADMLNHKSAEEATNKVSVASLNWSISLNNSTILTLRV